MSDLQTELSRLSRAWSAERDAARARYAEERTNTTLADRVEARIALRGLTLDEALPAPGERLLLWFRPERGTNLRDLRLGPGDPVLLWRVTPDEPGAVHGVLTRRSPDRVGVMVTADARDDLWDAGWRIDREAPEVTFARGRDALQAAAAEPPGSVDWQRLNVLFGVSAPSTKQAPMPVSEWFDARLEDDQREAVRRGLGRDLSLVLGPPGTGKTRTLAELVQQAVARGERVLVTAASHTAVDNLAERLVRAGVRLVRIGHPARVSPEMEAHTLDAMLERSDASELARGWIREAEAMKQKLRQREKRKATTWTERREVMTEVNGLYASAKRATRDAQRGILDGAAVIAVTAAGSESGQVAGQRFDRVVLDEATQAPDPIALVALQQAPAAVLAGDPHQLPPTVIGEEAERLGLGETFFERLAAGPHAGELVTLLRVQHRMHEALMAYPNAATYGGALRASAEVARALLTEVEGVREDPSRAGPFVLLDAVGRGWEEERTGDDPSTRNPGNAERVAAEVRRLVSRGVGAADIGVITPYQAQVREIRDRLSELVDAGLEVSSVDGFQGREKLVIVVDLVRSNDEGEIGFLRDVRRMNVALTRARRWMMVLGDGALMARHRYYKGLLEHAETTDAWLSAWADEAEALE
ncbi:MAG: AAA domain-containing protein [Deltaproteobacteria bacterium]|nr:AAA domain-containing protein [Myxococcales bacterium]MDP3221465.1 AAA domain-containing protein [Deltaproteobacteria bacterium]